MKITFDPVKRGDTLEKRGLDFADASFVFDSPIVTIEDRRRDYGETRWQTIGLLAGRMVMVVWTPRGDARHIFSMRKCNAREQAKYQRQTGAG